MDIQAGNQGKSTKNIAGHPHGRREILRRKDTVISIQDGTPNMFPAALIALFYIREQIFLGTCNLNLKKCKQFGVACNIVQHSFLQISCTNLCIGDATASGTVFMPQSRSIYWFVSTAKWYQHSHETRKSNCFQLASQLT